MKVSEIKQYISKEKTINSVIDFNNLFDFFSNENLKNERLELYQSYVISQGLNKLSEAKIQIIKNVFSEYISRSLNDYQKIIEEHNHIESDVSQIEIIGVNNQIKNIAKLSGIFKDYDEDNFNSYILNAVKGINIDEVIAIFDKVQISSQDIKLIGDTINKVLEADKKYSPENFAKDFINHELTDLFILPRKKSHIYNPNNFDKYESLATAISKHKIAENIEGFDGGLSYLIGLDLVYGLNSLKNSDNQNYKKISDLLTKVEDNKFDSSSLKELMVEAVKQSKNIKENQRGGYTDIKNSGNAFKLAGPADRIFNFNNYISLFLHTVSGNCDNENNQLGRTQQLKSDSEAEKYSVQIGTRPPINRKLNSYADDVTISRREQLILSNMRNFAYMAGEALKRKDVSILNTAPLELWASSMEASRNYMNDYLNTEDKINAVGNSWFYLIDKYKVLNQDISTNTQDPKHEHIINPLFLFAESLVSVYRGADENKDKYQQLLSNVYHVLKENEQVFHKINNDITFKFDSFMDSIELLNLKGRFEILEKNFSSIDLVNDPYIYKKHPIAEIVLMSDNPESNLLDFLNNNKDALMFNKLSDLDLEALNVLEESTRVKILPIIREFAISDLQSIYETEAAQNKIEPVKEIIDVLCDNEQDNRNFCGATNPTHANHAQIKLANMSSNIDKGKNREVLEILGKTAYITNANLYAGYEAKFYDKKDLNEQHGLLKKKL